MLPLSLLDTQPRAQTLIHSPKSVSNPPTELRSQESACCADTFLEKLKDARAAHGLPAPITIGLGLPQQLVAEVRMFPHFAVLDVNNLGHIHILAIFGDASHCPHPLKSLLTRSRFQSTISLLILYAFPVLFTWQSESALCVNMRLRVRDTCCNKILQTALKGWEGVRARATSSHPTTLNCFLSRNAAQ